MEARPPARAATVGPRPPSENKPSEGEPGSYNDDVQQPESRGERFFTRRVRGVNQDSASRAFTDHNGDVMAIWQREGPVHVQDVVLCAQEALQVLRVRGHLLGHSVRAPCADQSLGEEQRHAFLLTVHHHLYTTDGRLKNKQAATT